MVVTMAVDQACVAYMRRITFGDRLMVRVAAEANETRRLNRSEQSFKLGHPLLQTADASVIGSSRGPVGDRGEFDSHDALRDMLSGSADVQVSYDDYREGLLAMDGSLALAGGLDGDTSEGGGLSANLTVSALDYSTSVNAEGSWSVSPADEDARLMSFTGEFTSATGLTWTVIASNVETAPGCFDAVGGELTAIFGNDLGQVEVKAVFDDVCDGCSTLFINGVEQGQTCVPDSPLLNPRSEEEV